MATPYKAIIKSKSRELSWKEDLLLVDGEPHKVSPMNMSLDVFQRYKILKVSELKFIGGTASTKGGRWLVDGVEPIAIMLDPLRFGRKRATRTEAHTYHLLDQILDGKPPSWLTNKFSIPTPSELQAHVVAVAWVKEVYDHFPKRTVVARLPIFLSAFKPEKGQADINAKLDALKDTVEKIAGNETELRQTKQELGKAQEAASMTLKKAVSMWMRFNPPKMSAKTKALIEKAVKMYMNDPDMHSLAKIARVFNVSRQRVSQWFKSFTEHTGLKVVSDSRAAPTRLRTVCGHFADL
jgi:AraC-like DNA-binding protein